MRLKIKILLALVLANALVSSCTAIEDRLYPEHITLATKLERKTAYHIFHVRERGTIIEFYALPKRLEGLPPKDDPQYQTAKLALRRTELKYFVELTLKESVNAGYEHVHIHFSLPEKVTFLDGREGVIAKTYLILRVGKADVLRYFEKEERDYQAYFVPYFGEFIFGWPWGIPFEGKANHWARADAETLGWGD